MKDKNKENEKIEKKFKHEKCECEKDDLKHCRCEDDCDCGEDCDCCDCEDEECDCCDDECECGCNEKNNYLELAQRIQAEFDNYRKRNADAIKQAEQKGFINAVVKILPIIDSTSNAKRQIQDETFKKSIETVYNQMINILEDMNVKKIDAVGKDFDPNLHNAVLAEEVEGTEEGKVLEEFQEGFELDGKVIRYSVVKVSK